MAGEREAFPSATTRARLTVTSSDRHDADRREQRTQWIAILVALAWLSIGCVREPPASWLERGIGVLLAFVFAAPLAAIWPYRKTLPALDRTPRPANVTGRTSLDTEPDSEGVVNPYDLVTVTLDVDGTTVESHIADIVAAESIDRFVLGSTWTVYAFDDPHALGDEATHCRVILTEAHDDVVRPGYDLRRYILRNEPGPGSDLLQRRFAKPT